MRGPKYRPSPRSGRFPPASANEADGFLYLLPPPIGGWNTSNAPMLMPATDALVLDNIYPDVNDIILRKGHSSWATGLTGWVKSFLAYLSGPTSQLFAATDSGIWNVSSSGAVGAAATSCTNGDWYHINISNSGGNWLLAVNGIDPAKLYNGTSWAASGITGVNDADLWNIVLHKRRAWMIEKETMDAWYLAADAITGAATRFRFGPVFKKGGYLVAQFVWSIDGGQGIDDYFVTVTSEGEIAVYQGTDPASASTWALVGTFEVGKPLGRRCFIKYGGDVLYMSDRGIFQLSTLLASTSRQRSMSISQKIDEAFKSAGFLYKNNFGWQGTIFSNINALFINVPVVDQTTYHQFVMNDNTKAWCRFTGQNLACNIVYGDALFGGGNGEVFLMWSGRTDDGETIVGTCSQAYNAFGRGMQKQPKLFRPILGLTGAATVLLRCDADFKDMVDTTTYTYPGAMATSLWDVGLWDVARWDAEVTNIESRWTAVPAEPGFMHSFRLQVTSSASDISWKGTYVVSSPSGGML